MKTSYNNKYLRGAGLLSERGFVVGANIALKDRADRLKSGWSELAFIPPDGGLERLIRAPTPTVYNIKAVGVPDFTQSTTDAIEIS
jgi:hypothetical protein